jgi:hypothetical protein
MKGQISEAEVKSIIYQLLQVGLDAGGRGATGLTCGARARTGPPARRLVFFHRVRSPHPSGSTPRPAPAPRPPAPGPRPPTPRPPPNHPPRPSSTSTTTACGTAT